jgi:hypothetical protein
MSIKYHKFNIDDKEYKLKKMGLKDALWVSSQLSKITATPIISMIIDLLFKRSKEDQEENIETLNSLLSNADSFKENIPKLIELIADNIDLFILIFERILTDAIVCEKSDDGIKEVKFNLDDLSIDELDELAQIFIEAMKFNFEVGLKKIAKKLQFLELVQK